jgi:hypothetical protein
MGNISKYTNNTGIGLSMAVYLATDNYDHNHDPRTISATTLIKSTKQIILGERVRIAERPSGRPSVSVFDPDTRLRAYALE